LLNGALAFCEANEIPGKALLVDMDPVMLS